MSASRLDRADLRVEAMGDAEEEARELLWGGGRTEFSMNDGSASSRRRSCDKVQSGGGTGKRKQVGSDKPADGKGGR